MIDLDFNILTPQGYQGLVDSYKSMRCELPLRPLNDDNSSGIGDCVDLKIWSDSSRKVETATFHISTEGSPHVRAPPGAHAILGWNCLLAIEEFYGRQPALAPLRLGPEAKGQTEERARKREELKKQAEKSEKARLQRERQRRQAEEEKRLQKKRYYPVQCCVWIIAWIFNKPPRACDFQGRGRPEIEATMSSMETAKHYHILKHFLMISRDFATMLRASTLAVSRFITSNFRRKAHDVSGLDNGALLHEQESDKGHNQREKLSNMSSELNRDGSTSSELEYPEGKAHFTRAPDSLLSVEVQADTYSSDEHLGQCDFVYNVMVSSSKNEIQCRMVLSFRMDVNIMSATVHRRLNIALQPYYGNTIPVLGCEDRKPLGTVDIGWAFCGRMKRYETIFYVVADVEYDLLLGRPSMWQHELYKVDPEIVKRLYAP
ncbi:hypothetical protein AnigIFM60653_004479 [Aspergillus niger]|nr:hypothetical protein AnigIFM60653_004479 [Aspergillus niger]